MIDGGGNVRGLEVEEEVGFFRVEEGQSSETAVCVVSCVIKVHLLGVVEEEGAGPVCWVGGEWV